MNRTHVIFRERQRPALTGWQGKITSVLFRRVAMEGGAPGPGSVSGWISCPKKKYLGGKFCLLKNEMAVPPFVCLDFSCLFWGLKICAC